MFRFAKSLLSAFSHISFSPFSGTLTGALICLSFQSAFGACTSPAGVAGQFIYNTSDMTFCNGTDWVSMTIATTGTTCTEPGKISVAGSDIQFCNGTTGKWVSMDGPTSDGSCSKAGTIIWRNSGMQWCNPSLTWKLMSAPGDPCSGKSLGQACTGTTALYAGAFDSGKYMVTPGGCTNSTTPTCAGGADTLNKYWRGSSGTNSDVAAIIDIASTNTRSTQRGDVLTNFITADATVSSDSAAHFCSDMVYGGFSDWVLPSKTELSYIYCHALPAGTHDITRPREDPNCTTYGGKTSELTGFTFDNYLSGSEYFPGYVYTISFGNGDTGSDAKNSLKRVRCIRRY